LSGAVFLCRWYAVGGEVEDLRGASAWRVTLAAAGPLAADEKSVTTTRPPDFRHQHIFDESFRSKELLHRPAKGKGGTRGGVVWTRAQPAGPQPFLLSYSFRCVL